MQRRNGGSEAVVVQMSHDVHDYLEVPLLLGSEESEI